MSKQYATLEDLASALEKAFGLGIGNKDVECYVNGPNEVGLRVGGVNVGFYGFRYTAKGWVPLGGLWSAMPPSGVRTLYLALEWDLESV